jgi:hypothetical protein
MVHRYVADKRSKMEERLKERPFIKAEFMTHTLPNLGMPARAVTKGSMVSIYELYLSLIQT